MKETSFKALFAVVCGGLSAYFGVIGVPLAVLFAAMCIDYLTGMTKAWVTGELSSRVGVLGIVKKVGCYGMVGGTGVTSRVNAQHTRTSANGAQITPYMHAEGGVVCESIALVDIMDSLAHVGKVDVNGDSWYVVGALAIKEE